MTNGSSTAVGALENGHWQLKAGVSSAGDQAGAKRITP